MRICILSRSFHPTVGGLERMGQILAAEFSRMGNQVEVVTDTLSDQADIGPYIVTRTGSLGSRVRAFKKADVVLFMNMSLHGLLAALVSGRPFVVSHHSAYSTRSFRDCVLENTKRFLTKFTRNIACSHYVAEELNARARVVPNAYLGRPHPDSRRKRSRDFVLCGRLVSDKGGALCLHAFRDVVDAVPDATLTIVGDGPERGNLERLASTLQVEKAVRFTGWLGEGPLGEVLSEHACAVVPSLWEEPFGMVALEGVGWCDTVIVTKRGGLPEAVGRCGVVVEPTRTALAAAMTTVAAARRMDCTLPGEPTPVEREAHLRMHAPETIAEQYLGVLEDAAAKDGARL